MKMNSVNQHPPILLLLDGSAAGDASSIKQWFENSRYLTWEATDIFDAIEEISDFTVQNRPDVVLIESNSRYKDMLFIRTLVESLPGDAHMPVIDFPEFGHSADGDGTLEKCLARLDIRLDQLIPTQSAVAH
ncbi:MAG: hypothetical protein WKF92_05570 [Pyrinomonadaceae bacterium]